MSRIQNILDKAERDGAARRVWPMPEAAQPMVPARSAATAGAFPITAGSTATDPDRATLNPATVAPPAAPAAPPAAPTHVVPRAPLDPRLVTATEVNSVAAEQYRALRTRILHTDSGGAVNVVLVTSPGRGEGKSLTVANLGLTMAQDSQQRICVVDADLRAPQQAALFGLREAPGLTDVLVGRATLDESLTRIEEHQITVLPAGASAAHPAELLGTVAMRRALDTLRTRFDRVIIDVPAATPLADVGILCPLADSVLIVVRAGVTSKPAIHDAVAAIDPGKLMGFVLNEAAA